MTLETFITVWLIVGMGSAWIAALVWSQDDAFKKISQSMIWTIVILSVLSGPITLFVLWLDLHNQNKSKGKRQ